MSTSCTISFRAVVILKTIFAKGLWAYIWKYGTTIFVPFFIQNVKYGHNFSKVKIVTQLLFFISRVKARRISTTFGLWAHRSFGKYRKTSNISRSGQLKYRSFRCSWSIACLRCSNYIFILDLTSGFKGFGKGSRKTIRESCGCLDLVRLMLETWR